MKHGISRYFLISCFLLLGCSSSSLHKKPNTVGDRLSSEQAAPVLRQIETRTQELYSFKALARVRFNQGESTQSARQVIAFERPDRIHIETLPLNTAYALNLLISQDGQATYLDLVEKTAIQGNAEQEFFRSTLHVPSSEQDLFPLFTARVPQRFLNADQVTLYFDPSSSTYTIVKGDFGYFWNIDSQTLLARECQIRDEFQNELLFRITYDEAVEEATLPTPESVVIDIPSQKLIVDVHFSSPTINQSMDPKLFSVAIPEGFRIRGQ